MFFSKSQKYVLELVAHGYLFDHGFVESKKTGDVVFKDGSPQPWLSYPFLDFFIPRLKNDISLFEYGLGNSTRYFSKKVIHHNGVEHDQSWFAKIEKELGGDNFKFVDEANYVSSISDFGKKYNLIIVDGILREKCLMYCKDFLEEDGVIILDDAERNEYVESSNALLQQGFNRLDFVGMKAFGRHASSTAIFYKKGNWLNI